MAKRIKNEEYWRTAFSVSEEEELALQTHIEESGTPLALDEMTRLIVRQQLADDADANAGIYSPHEQYESGTALTFPALDNVKGQVITVREGDNPRYGIYEVIAVRFGNGSEPREFISASAGFQLQSDLPQLSPRLSEEEILSGFGEEIASVVQAALEDSGEYVTYGGKWLPKALLSEVHEGHLNIAEAMLEMVGSALTTVELLPELDLEGNASAAIKNFSVDFALSQDSRFVSLGNDSESKWTINR